MKRLSLFLAFVCLAAPVHAQILLKQSTATTVQGKLTKIADGTDHTGLAVTSITLKIVKQSDTTASTVTSVTCAAAASANDCVEIASTGLYNAELSASDTDTLGRLDFCMQASGDYSDCTRYQVVSSGYWDLVHTGPSTAPTNFSSLSIDGSGRLDISKILGTAISTPATAGVLDVNVKNIDNDAASASGTVTFPNATLASTTNITGGTITTVTTTTTATNVTTVNGLAANVITAASIATDAIGAAEIADGAIDAGALASDTITAAKIATDAIGAAELAADSITSSEIATGAIGAAEIADAALDRATYAVDTGHISIRSNTATAGANGTITLDASASAVDDFYNNATILLTGGTGAGQTRAVQDYTGATKVLTVNANWATNPDNTTTFALIPMGLSPAVSGLTAADVWGHGTRELTALGTGVITATTFGAGAIDAAAIAASAIGASEIASDAITAAKIASDAITAAKIASDAVTADELASDVATEIQTGLVSFKKATALASLYIKARTALGAAVTGATPSCAASRDSAVLSSTGVSNNAEIGNGTYSINLTSGAMTGNSIYLYCTFSGGSGTAVAYEQFIYTQQ